VILELVSISKVIQKLPFDCGHQVLNDFFKLYAFKNDRLSIGKTFVAVRQDAAVAGYMTLASAQIEAETLPQSMRLILPRYPVQAFRIAKLAVDVRFQGQGVGAWLLKSAFEKALSVSTSVGLYAIIVDAINEKAMSFYVKYGFIAFTERPQTLFLPLSTVAHAFGSD
jgi:GNAT superfamily N-acetyltransferase